MNFMIGIVVTGGDAPPSHIAISYLEKADYIVAADSGLDTLEQYGFSPHMIVGDMDSLKDKSILENYDNQSIQVFPEEKDYTDTELALEHLREKGCDQLWLLGGGGGRLDHLLAIYSIFFREDCPSLWINQKEKILLVKENFCINLKIGTTVSLFPLSPEICIMESEGLKWSLNPLRWKIGDLGISNISVNEKVSIQMKSGKLLMILPLGTTV